MCSSDLGRTPLRSYRLLLASGLAEEVYEEGVIIPLMRMYEAGKPNETLFTLLMRNVRFGEKVMGDIRAQIASCWVGCEALTRIARDHRLTDLRAVADALNRHAVNPDNGQFLPKPADIVRLINGNTVDRALVAWSTVERAIRSTGPYQSVVFDSPEIIGLAVVAAVPPFIDARASEFGVTDKRVVIKVGLIRRRTLELLLRQIEAIAVEQTVPDAEVRDFIFHYNGPDAPIVAKAGRILAWGCERHNCGYHNWAVSVLPDGSSPEICFYHDDEHADGAAHWFLPGGKAETRSGNCPSE